MKRYVKVEDVNGNQYFIAATDYPLLGTDKKVTVFEQWPGCRIDTNGYWISCTCTRRSQVKTKVYIGSFLKVIKNES